MQTIRSPINRQILKLAIPNVLSNLSVPLLSSVDTAILGHLEKITYLGALAVAGIIFNFVYWGFGFLRMGTTGLTAQAFGNGDKKQISLILSRTGLIALASGFILIICQWFIADIGFWLVDATPEVETYAREYFHIRIYAAPATLLLYALHGWFLGMQNAKYPLILTIFVNAVNIAFNFLFVYGFDMKSDGVAYGTVIAQYSGLVLCTVLFLKKYREFNPLKWFDQLFDRQQLRRIFQVNGDIFIRTLALIFTFSYFTAKSAESGDQILAVNSILLQLINLLAYGVDGFAFAAESLVGKYKGAADSGNLRQTVRHSFFWGLSLGVMLAVIFLFFGESILRVFTDKSQVIDESMVYMAWIVIAPLVNSWCFIWDGVYIGATATAPMRNSMLFCAFLVFLPCYFLFRESLGNHSLWLALTLFMVARGLTLSWSARRHIYGET